jgi:uncharacterized membrane protein
MFGFHVIWMLVLFMGLALPIVLIVLVVLAVTASHRGTYSTTAAQAGSPPVATPARETPMEILARRFASGEISAEEYQRAMDLLRGGGKP